jgi:hypothetical protein
MIVFYKKKLYLKNFYKAFFDGTKFILIYQLNDIKSLSLLRADLKKMDINVKVIKNNMVKKLLEINLQNVFRGSTICVSGNVLQQNFISYLEKNREILLNVIVKVDNYLVMPLIFKELLVNFKLNSLAVILKNLNILFNTVKQLFIYLLKYYFILFKLCRR